MLASESSEPSCYQALQPPQKAALSGDKSTDTSPTGLPAPTRPQAHTRARAPMREHAEAPTRARPGDCWRTSSQVIGRADVAGDLVYEHSANKYW